MFSKFAVLDHSGETLFANSLYAVRIRQVGIADHATKRSGGEDKVKSTPRVERFLVPQNVGCQARQQMRWTMGTLKQWIYSQRKDHIAARNGRLSIRRSRTYVESADTGCCRLELVNLGWTRPAVYSDR